MNEWMDELIKRTFKTVAAGRVQKSSQYGQPQEKNPHSISREVQNFCGIVKIVMYLLHDIP